MKKNEHVYKFTGIMQNIDKYVAGSSSCRAYNVAYVIGYNQT